MNNPPSTFCILLLLLSSTLYAYPIDGYASTGIRRLERLRLIVAQALPGKAPVTGARKTSTEIKLHLVESAHDDVYFFHEDPKLKTQLTALFSQEDPHYSLLILDLNAERPRYATLRPDELYKPGSVGKLAVAAGFFTELARLYPDPADRLRLLKNHKVTASAWIRSDHHTIPVFDPTTRAYKARLLREGDVFSLYEWLDHMLSASSNSAASMVWKEAMLMRAFGKDYPPSAQAESEFFKKTPPLERQKLSLSVVNDPLRTLGIPSEAWQLGSFFTRAGKQQVPGVQSYANPRALLIFLLRLEQGRIVDPWSSLELKKLIYMTARRIRYAAADNLSTSAVYFKSGSEYKCQAETGFVCREYAGNVKNYMNSVAIVEHPGRQAYLAVLMSNVLRKNSANDHKRMAEAIDRLVISFDPPPPPVVPARVPTAAVKRAK